MAYDFLLRNGTIVDGSGMSAYRGDLAIKDGKIAEIGKLDGAAADRTIDVGGQVIAPGFIDNHCHYDAQVTWDPLCSFSSNHGATTVIIGNCSLALAPIRRGKERRLAEFLSYIEAIPMEVLDTVKFDWETFPQYMDKVDQRLGVNVGTLIGHTAVRYYVMGDESQTRTATDDEIELMRGVVRESMEAGAIGLSVSRNQAHYDPQGARIPAVWADTKEIFALADVLRELGTGTIQCAAGSKAEMKDGMMTRLAEFAGRPVVYNSIQQSARRPGDWRAQLARVDETVKAGIRAYPMCSPHRTTRTFTMKNAQIFRGLPTWHSILLSSDEEKLRAYADPEVRRKLHVEAVEFKTEAPGGNITKYWPDYMYIGAPVLDKNKWMEGKSIRQIAEMQNKGIIESFLDLVVEDKLETEVIRGENNFDDAAVKEILCSPNTLIGQSDGGAHVQYPGAYGYSTYLLGERVRNKNQMSLELAVRKLTFDSASLFGLFDRGLLRPGMAADITVFDPDTVGTMKQSVVHDFPAGGWRYKEPASGVYATFVNGEMLMHEDKHTGALPGRVLRNSLYQRSH